MSFFSNLTASGSAFVETPSEKRNVILSNYISIIIACVPVLLVIAVFFLADFDGALIGRLLLGSFLFSIPLICNRLGLVFLSRVLLCWLPPLVVFAISIIDVKQGSPMSASSYVGLRLFLIPTGCFPFLVFNLKSPGYMLLSLLAPTLSLLFFDEIFTFFGTAYWERNPFDPLYAFNNIRAFCSFIAIGSSCYLLKRIVERNEGINAQLMSELAEKNLMIKRQADDEVHELNRQLNSNLAQLREREFILNQSQTIAKIGSWEYKIRNASLFCSDEIYNIFGIDRSFDFTVENLTAVFLEEDRTILMNSIIVLLKSGKSFDLTFRLLTPLGHTKWIRMNAFPIEEYGRITGGRGICHDITFFRESEDLLRSSEKKYRSLFEQASDFILVVDFEGRILDVNASICAEFGYSKEELVHMNNAELIDPEDLKKRPLPLAALARGEHFLTARRMMRKDGTILVVESNVRKIQEDRILVIARDVTQLREVQRQIEISEARFRGAFEYSAIGMALVSPELKWLRVNKGLCHILGYEESELLLMTVADVTHPDEIQKDMSANQLLLSGRIETFRSQKRYIHKSGSIVWANLNVSLIKDHLDYPHYFVSQIEDITAEKNAEQQLQLSRANLSATINNTEVLIWSIDRDFGLLMFNNPFFQHMKVNYGMEVKVGDNIFGQIAHEGDALNRAWSRNFDRVFNGERFTLEETRFGIDFHYSISPILEAGNIVGASVFADNITERKMRDRELAEANKKVGEYKLMALRSVMSPHFIFNVLNSIQFYIAKSDRFNAIHYLSTFSKLIRSILAHSVDNKIKLIDEVEMLRNYVALEMTRFETKFTFAMEIDPSIELGAVQIPSLLIQPYVENAILHGLYNKKDLGKLTVRIAELDDCVVFEIEDDGIGRAAATALRSQNFPSHKSVGIRVTEERLKLINQQNHTAFEIKDLTDQNGDPSGTKVIIRITI